MLKKGGFLLKRAFLALICVFLAMPCFCVPASAATEDYRGWAQMDSRWGDLVMGSNQEATVAGYGCTSVCITKLLRQSGAVTPGYTPRDFVNHMNTIGNYTSEGTIANWEKTDIPGIGLTYQGRTTGLSTSKAVSLAKSYVEDGYYVIVKGKVTLYDKKTEKYKQFDHFCAVDNTKTKAKDKLIIMNSWSNTKNNVNREYSAIFDNLSAVYYFSASGIIHYEKVTSGNYYLKNGLRGTYITLKDGVDANKQAVTLQEFDGSASMQLAITYSQEGSTIRPLASGARVLEPVREENAVTSGDLLNIRGVSTTRASNQGWLFQKVGEGYVIRNVSNPDCVLSAVNGELKMQTYDKEKTQQIWYLVPVEKEPEGVKLEMLYSEGQLDCTISPGDVTGSAALIAVLYEGDKMVRMLSMEPVVLDGQQITIPVTLEEKQGRVKAFLIDGDARPLCRAQEGSFGEMRG